jgi:hypothetical protein
MQSEIQSMCHECPRLIWLSFNELRAFYDTWLQLKQDPSPLDPYIQKLFRGFGHLRIKSESQEQRLEKAREGELNLMEIVGFISYEHDEYVHFQIPIVISPNLSLPTFVSLFENAIRQQLFLTMDSIHEQRLRLITKTANDKGASNIFELLVSFFALRLSEPDFQIQMPSYCGHGTNQAIVLSSAVAFCEDLNVALGCTSGAYAGVLVTFNLISTLQSEIGAIWKELIVTLVKICSTNARHLSSFLQNRPPSTGNDIFGERKLFGLRASLLSHELYVLQILGHVASAPNLSVAREIWRNCPQYRYLPHSLSVGSCRFDHSPLEIVVGEFVCPFGMEYVGAQVPLIADVNTNRCLRVLFEATFCCRAALMTIETSTVSNTIDEQYDLRSIRFASCLRTFLSKSNILKCI